MLISVLISISIFLILAHAIFTLISSSFEFVSFNKARITARHLAEEKMEIIRNLPYDDVGTLGGIPSGIILQDEDTDRNGLSFKVRTSIIYVDDPFDQQVPYDLLPTDYKRARVEVSWGGIGGSRKNPVVYVTDVAPKGVETTGTGGTLSILVFDANAQPVSGATVAITAPSAVPPVNLNLQTGSNGRIILPGAPPCTNCYSISVSKSGYTNDRTYLTSEVTNPNKPSLTILQGELTETSFSIDKVSTINIATTNSRADNFSPLSAVSLTISGSKTIGTDSTGTPVYKYTNTITTNASGSYSLSDVEWDSYSIKLNSISYDVSGNYPALPISTVPDTTTDFKMALATKSTNSLLLNFDGQSSNPIASVSATLTDGGSFNQTVFSGDSENPDFGQAFFSNLDINTYTLTATASGFLDYTSNIPVSGKSFENIILTPQ